jgi:hypothetical protein
MKQYGYQDLLSLMVGSFGPRPLGHWSVNYLLLQPEHCRDLMHLMAPRIVDHHDGLAIPHSNTPIDRNPT